MAEIDFSIFSKQSLDRRTGDDEILQREIAAPEAQPTPGIGVASGA